MKMIVMIFLAASIAACNSGQNANSGADSNVGSIDTATTLSSIDKATSDFLQAATMVNKMEIEAGKLGQKQAGNAEVKAFANLLVEDHTNAMDQLKTLAYKKRIEIPVSITVGENIATSGGTGDIIDDKNNNTKPGVTGSANNTATSTSTPTAASTTASGTGSSTEEDNNPATISSTVDGTAGSGSRPSGTILNTETAQRSMLGKLRSRTGADFDRQFLQMMVNDHQKAIDLFEKASVISDPDIQAHAKQMLPVLRRHEDRAKSLLKSLQ